MLKNCSRLLLRGGIMLLLVPPLWSHPWALSPMEQSGGDRIVGGQSEWTEVGSENFLLYTNTDVSKGTRLLGDLEARYAAFSRVFFPLEPRQFRIRVLLVDGRQEFQNFVPEAVQIHDRSAYLVQGPGGPFLLARDEDPSDIADDAGHSLGHLILSRAVLWTPFWLQEGVGEYSER